MKKIKKVLTTSLIFISLVLGALAFVAGQSQLRFYKKIPKHVEILKESFLKNLPKKTQDDYEAALEAPTLFEKTACYCGCVYQKHRNLKDCFIAKQTHEKITFEKHGLSCKTCLNEAEKIMLLKRQGYNQEQIIQIIEKEFSQYGPATQK